MKTIYEHSIGGDGAIAGLYISDDGYIVEQVKYPISNGIDAAEQFIDKQVDGLEAKLGWTKSVIEPLRAAAKAWLETFKAPVG